MEKKYKYLDGTPKISGVNGFFDRRFIEKMTGEKDVKGRQVCKCEDGYTTPYVDYKSKCYDSYINKIYLKTSMGLADIVREANSLVIELKMIEKMNSGSLFGNGEEALRQKAQTALNNAQKENRKREILIRIAAIKAESDMVDEALLHHIERARDILHSHISNYWSGVLSKSDEKLEYYPFIAESNYLGRDIYIQNKDRLIEMLNIALAGGGDKHEEENV